MEKIVGRDKEMAMLAEYMQSGRPEFVAVYGRRRVGKTFLVRSFFKDKFAFYATGIIDGDRSEEMEAFHTALVTYGYKGQKAKTWIEAFVALADLLKKKNRNKNKRLVVFVDELPCFDTPNSGFVHALDFFWNSRGSWMDNIMFVICGSATSWMIRNVVHNRGGLHNRLTHHIHLRPFTLAQTEQYFRSRKLRWSRMMVLQAYMAVGGVPYYLSLLDASLGVPDNIDRLFFGEEALLKDEYRQLYKSLYRNPENYMEIIALLANHHEGLTRKEIAEKLKVVSNGHLTDMLDDLVHCDFLRLYRVGTKKRGGIYQLTDLFTLFYLAYQKQMNGDAHYWRNLLNTPKQNTWLGLAFENVCLLHHHQIVKSLHLDSIHTDFYAWRSKESDPAVQIDMVIDRADGIVNIVEIKYSKDVYTVKKSEYKKIVHRETVFREETKTKKGVQIAMITTNGIVKNEYADEIVNVLNINDLFE